MTDSPRWWLPVVGLVCAASGCSTTPTPTEVDASSTLDAGQDGGFVVASHAPLPQIPSFGGPVLAHPQLVVVTYADDPNRDAMEAYVAWLVTSGWLSTVGAEYGVGNGDVLANIHLPMAAPTEITTHEITAMLRSGTADGSIPRNANGTLRDVLYLVYLPRTTTLHDPYSGDSCVGYGGFHTETSTGSEALAFAIVPTCDHRDLSEIETLEVGTSHEIIEAATDPFPESAPTYTFPWGPVVQSPFTFLGGENADLCALRVGPGEVYREGDHVTARVWSNAAAAAGDRDPCLPEVSSPYAGLAATPSSVVPVAAGGETTFQLDVWTTGPMPGLQLSGAPAAAAPGMFVPTIVVDGGPVDNGSRASLRVGVPAGTPPGQYGLVYLFLLTSQSQYQVFPVAVVSE